MTNSPKVTVPRGMLYCIGVLFVSNFAIVCLVPSLPPGIASAATAAYPLTNGFRLAYDLSASSSAWLVFPAHVGAALGFLRPSGRLVQALADSSLLPPWLGLKSAAYTGRWKAVTIASMFGYVLCVLSYFFQVFAKALPHLAMLAACGCYAAQLVGFILLRTSYKAECHGYRSPFGIGSAVLAIGSFGILAISILGAFQDDDGVAALTYLAYVVVISLYYYVACKDRQTVSKDEYASIFRFTIIKFNNMKRRMTRQNQRKSSQWTKVISLLQSNSTLSSSNRVSYVDVGVNRGSRLSQPRRMSIAPK
ncbi:hypothetical protein SDRG_15488 [Saprolegnia diclina VS20]|nr:hypothetical protein SDRG_15488 [Saprolegnia diclina VS20]EQC26703.1 hypothetical protein SDRG_15488 [Saprolegnia diclina VS20]|eukprot:XP_008619885.1 hypothetical protein SDRG_15488 [Saprolegnia diclina VS20]